MDLKPEIIERLKKLDAKYSAIGQDLESYLDGLLYSNPLYYWDYIHVDALLSLQQPKTDFPDEKIFIVYHQITELYFSLTQHELDQISGNGKIISEAGQDLGWNEQMSAKFLLERIERINRYFDALTLSFDIMRTGMEKEQFLKFRMSLLPASGFQAASYRKIEISCTDLKNLVHQSKRDELASASLGEQLDNIYWNQGAIIEETGEKTLTLKLFEDKYLEEFLELAEDKKNSNLWSKFKEVQGRGEASEELVNQMKKLDANININWPLVHYKTAARYMAREDEDVPATGGTNWQKYLPPRFQKRIFFPELWTTQEQDEWGRNWVESIVKGKA